jgi:hypothetical protein
VFLLGKKLQQKKDAFPRGKASLAIFNNPKKSGLSFYKTAENNPHLLYPRKS